MSIERKIYVTKNYFVEPVSVVYGSTEIPIDLELADYTIPSGATAVAYTRRTHGGSTYKTAAAVSGNHVIVTTEAGVFIPGKNVLQVELTVGSATLISFCVPVLCGERLSTGAIVSPETVETWLEQAEATVKPYTEAAQAAADEAKSAAEAAQTAADEAKSAAETAADEAKSAAETAAAEASTLAAKEAAEKAEANIAAAEASRVAAEKARETAEAAREAASAEAVTNCEEATAALIAAENRIVWVYDETDGGLNCIIYEEE